MNDDLNDDNKHDPPAMVFRRSPQTSLAYGIATDMTLRTLLPMKPSNIFHGGSRHLGFWTLLKLF